MKKIKYQLIFLSIVLGLIGFSCTKKENNVKLPLRIDNYFDPDSLIIKGTDKIKKVRGQVLYLPIYSNIPYTSNYRKHDLSAFIAIHNTDIHNSLKITKVLFFDNDGKLVSNYLPKDTILHPLGATYYYVPERDKSGTGANFLVEWVSDSLITEPLVESVMLNINHGQGISFLSTGKIIREIY